MKKLAAILPPIFICAIVLAQSIEAVQGISMLGKTQVCVPAFRP
jgi:hypothetical protein